MNFVVTSDDRLQVHDVPFVLAVIHHEPQSGLTGKGAPKTKRMHVDERILNGHGPLDRVRSGSFPPFGKVQLDAVHETVRVQIGRVTETYRIDDDRVALPVADRMSEGLWDVVRFFGMTAAVLNGT